jgi:uptake hydrogenase large subunit
MADFAGSLNIRLSRASGGFGVAIESSRPVTACRVFVGRTVSETLERLPALFSICATAQASACVGACEAALGLVPGPAAADLRHLLVDAETLKEHLWRILLDWPRFLGEAPQAQGMAAVMHAYSALRRALGAAEVLTPGAESASGADRTAAGRALDQLARVITEQVFGIPAADWLAEAREPDDLTAWSRRSSTLAARVLRLVQESGWVSLGDTEVQPLPDLSAETLEGLLGGDRAGEFVAAPLWQGLPAETSPYTRNAGHPLVTALTAGHGGGLLARLAGKLVELATVQEGLGRAIAGRGVRNGVAERRTDSGVGLAQVAAARGLLVHRVVLAGDRVEDYRILAPTEWNFHRDGVVARGLAGLPAGDEPTLRRQAAMLITAVDPCVDYDVSIS